MNLDLTRVLLFAISVAGGVVLMVAHPTEAASQAGAGLIGMAGGVMVSQALPQPGARKERKPHREKE